MTNIKSIITLFIIELILFTFISCRHSCDNIHSGSTIYNNGKQSINVTIFTSQGDSLSIGEIKPNMKSNKISLEEGKTEFIIGVDTIKYFKTCNLINCYIYDVYIDSNYNITLDSMHYQWK